MKLELKQYIPFLEIEKYRKIKLISLRNFGFNEKQLFEGASEIYTFEANKYDFKSEFDFLCHVETIHMVTDKGISVSDEYENRALNLETIKRYELNERLDAILRSYYGMSEVQTWKSEIFFNNIESAYRVDAGWHGQYLFCYDDNIYFVFQYIPID